MDRRVVLTVAAVLAMAVTAGGCHVVTQLETTRPGSTEVVHHLGPARAVAQRPTLVITDAGALRFVEPLECPTEEHVTTTSSIELVTEANLATFVVGVVATATGGLLLVNGLSETSHANPYTYGGAGALAVGLPFAIGPWLGTHSEHRVRPEPPLLKPGLPEPCGERPLVATAATLTLRGIEVYGRVDRDGTFAISPFQLADAFDPRSIPAWDVSAIVDTANGPRAVAVVFEPGVLARHAPTFLAHADFDATIQPLRIVPRISTGVLRASLTSTDDGPALRLVLPLTNDGPGDVYALRGFVSSSTKAIDGRVIYLGHVANQAGVTRELLIPLSGAAANTILGAAIDVSVELRDAHGTAPATPMRFRGEVLGDAPR